MNGWQFCIDVGGTFTDCLATSPDGEAEALKVLSSGVVKGRVARILDDGGLEVSELDAYPAGFFEGYRLRLIGVGESEAELRVRSHTCSPSVLRLM